MEKTATGVYAPEFILTLLVPLGFAIKWEKPVGPARRVQFLGLIIDSVENRLKPLQVKLVNLQSMCAKYENLSKFTKREVQMLIGHMSFAAKAIYASRPFSRIFIDVLLKLEKPSHRTRITNLLKSELLWWQKFASVRNAKVDCALGYSRKHVSLHIDACLEGFAAVLRGNCLAGASAAGESKHSAPMNSGFGTKLATVT